MNNNGNGWTKVKKNATGQGHSFLGRAELLARVYSQSGDIVLTDAAYYAIGAPRKICFLSNGRMAAICAAQDDDPDGYPISPVNSGANTRRAARSRAKCAIDEVGMLMPGLIVTYALHVEGGMLVTDTKTDRTETTPETHRNRRRTA